MKKNIVFISLLSIICIALIVVPFFIFQDTPICASIINIKYNDVIIVDEDYEINYKEILQQNKEVKDYRKYYYY